MRYKSNVDGPTERIRELLYSTDDSLRSIGRKLGLSGAAPGGWLNAGNNPRAYAIVQL